MTTLTAAEIVALQETLAAAVALSADLPSGAQSAITAAAVQAAYAQSLVLTATPPPTPNLPAAPTSFAAAVSTSPSTSVGLLWTNAVGTTTGTIIGRDGTQIGTVGAGVSTYTDQNVAVGTHTYTVANTNSFGTGPTDSVSATIGSPSTLTLASIVTQNLVMGAAFTLTLVGVGGVSPYTWATSAALPKGLVLAVTSATTATISGTPSAAGTTSVTLTVTDSTAGTHQTASVTFSIVVANPPSLTITEPTGFPITNSQAGPATATMPHAYAQVGDLAIANVIINSASVTVSGITSPNAGPWTRSLPPYQDSLLGQTLEQWSAPVTTAGVVDTLALTYSGSATVDIFLDSKEGAGATSMWQVVTSSTSTSGNPSGGVTATAYPPLLSATTTNPQTYVGLLVSGNVAEGGSTSGVVYVDSTSGNEMIYKLAVGSAATLSPTGTQLAGWYDAIAVIYELTSSGLGSSVLAVNSVANQSVQVSTAFPALTLATTGGSGTKTFAITAGGLPTGMALNTSTGVISGTPTVVVTAKSVTITASDSSSPVQTAPVTFTVTVTSVPTPPAAGTPNVPAGTVVPTTNTFVAQFGTAAPNLFDTTKPFNGLDLVHWLPWFLANGASQNGTQSSSNQVKIQTDGLHLTLGADPGPSITGLAHPITAGNITMGAICSASAAGGAAGLPAGYKGLRIQATDGHPVFTEWNAKLANNGSGPMHVNALWQTGDTNNWPAAGETDIVETNNGGPIDDCQIFAPGGAFSNGPHGQTQHPWDPAYNGFCTYGVLWTTSGNSFFYNGKLMETTSYNGGGEGLGPFFLVAFTAIGSQSLPVTMIVQSVKIWQD